MEASYQSWHKGRNWAAIRCFDKWDWIKKLRILQNIKPGNGSLDQRQKKVRARRTTSVHQWLDLLEKKKRKKESLQPLTAARHKWRRPCATIPFFPSLKSVKMLWLVIGQESWKFQAPTLFKHSFTLLFPLPPHSLTEMDKSFTLGHVLSAGAVGLLTGYFFSQSALVRSLLFVTGYASIEKSETKITIILTISQWST